MTHNISVFRSPFLIPGLAFLILVSLVDFSQAYQGNKKRDLTGSVTGADGEPVAGARIVVAYKSWPNNRFRLKTYASKTNADGQFVFKKFYMLNQPSEFLVTVVANGHAMTSEYLENQSGEELDVLTFSLNSAIEKTITIYDGDKPLAKARVYPSTRTTSGGKEHQVYPASASKLTLLTDEYGQVKMNIFQPGDQVAIGIHRKGSIKIKNLTINESSEQSIGGPTGGGGAVGSDFLVNVSGSDGKPVADATVLLAHKTWPNNRFQMLTYSGESDDKGDYTLADVYEPGGRNGILVSVLAEGFEMQSQYLLTEGDDLQPFEFKPKSVPSVKFHFENANGKPIVGAPVLPMRRKDKSGKEHLIYPASARNFSYKTGADGSLDLALFEAGDTVEFQIQLPTGSERVNVTIEDKDQQTVTVKKKITQ